MENFTESHLHFTLGTEINTEGKNSKVYFATDHQLGAELCIKQIEKDKFNDSISYFNESKHLYSCNHKNIASIQYATQDENNIYLAMPYYVKGSLNKLISESNSLSLKEIIKYSTDFLSGLHFIHSKKLLHCDIKPTNILLSNSNDAVLTDFGLARYLNDEGFAEMDLLYLKHRAPELMIQGQVLATQQADIYQAGLTIYRLCNGNDQFESQMKIYIEGQRDFAKDVLNEVFPDRKAFQPHIPSSLRKCIVKALKSDTSKRYNTVLEFLNDLAKIEIPKNWKKSNNNTWSCQSGTMEYNVNLSFSGNKYAVSANKLNILTHTQSKCTSYCKSELDLAKSLELIENFVAEINNISNS